MPTLAALLKEEISKVARKEVQDQVRELKQTVRAQRDAIARLEKQLGSAKANRYQTSRRQTSRYQTGRCQTSRQSPQTRRRWR